MGIKEKIYILCRRIKSMENCIFMMFFSLFPLVRRVCVCSFEGKGGFGCNPKYIVEEIHRRYGKIEIVWIVKDLNKEFPGYIKKVPDTVFWRCYYLSTSKIWIDNYRKPYGTIKIRNQFYLQTWHAGIGFKKIGLYRGTAFSKMAYLVSKADSNMIDCTIVDSLWCKAVYPKGLLYEGKILMSGAPRCDVFFNKKTEIRRGLRERLGIGQEIKIILFAPTFRETKVDGKRKVYLDNWSLDFERQINAFEQRFGGKWVWTVKVHPQIAADRREYDNTKLIKKVYDLSNIDDMYEILPGVDALITDYSSTIFESGLTRIPSFMYAEDLDIYTEQRGGLFFDFSGYHGGKVCNKEEDTPGIKSEFPFSVNKSNDELFESIISFNEKEYDAKLSAFEKNMGILSDGNASCRVVEYLEKNIGIDKW